MSRAARAEPATSCPDCLSWGASYGLHSYCRACYDFTRRYRPGECASCQRVIAVKKGHCRLCWLQAGIVASPRRRITPADFVPGSGQQLSFAGMSRIGHTGPRPAAPAGRRPQPAPDGEGRGDTAATADSRRVPALRQTPLGRLQHHRPVPDPDPPHRRRARRDPRLEPPDHHRDRPCPGRRPGRSHPRRHDRLVSAVPGAALP